MRRVQAHRSRGFSLVELLVAVAILGILIATIVALTSGFLGFSRRVSAINERLADLNDAMGYVALNARRAVAVIGEGSQVTVGTGAPSFTCNVAANCMALVVPVTDEDGDIGGYDFLAYRVVPLAAWSANPGIQGGWDGTNTPVLLEYFRRLCTGTGCTMPAIAGTTVDPTRVSLVIADLYLEDGAPLASFDPFEIGQQGRRITISLRTRGSGREAGLVVPSGGRLALQAVQRP